VLPENFLLCVNGGLRAPVLAGANGHGRGANDSLGQCGSPVPLTSDGSVSGRRVRRGQPLRAAIQPREHRNFAGAIARSDWGAAGNAFLRIMGGRYGDHRNWPAIDDWATNIAAQLAAAKTKGLTACGPLPPGFTPPPSERMRQLWRGSARVPCGLRQVSLGLAR
jgi:hypothetical protein